MAEEQKAEKKGGWLTKAFKAVAYVATIGLMAAVGWQMFLDPLFFGPIHDVMNVTMQSWVAFIQDKFGWIPNLVGATGSGGLLKTPFMKSVLAPYADQVAVLSPEQLTGTGIKGAADGIQGFSMDTLSSP